MPAADEMDEDELDDARFEARVETLRVELPLARARKLLTREDLDPGIREALETAIDGQYLSKEKIRESVDRTLRRKYGAPKGAA